MLFSIELLKCGSCTRDEKDTDGYSLAIYCLGLLIELQLTVRNPLK
jgi:hypothetical protein